MHFARSELLALCRLQPTVLSQPVRIIGRHACEMISESNTVLPVAERQQAVGHTSLYTLRHAAKKRSYQLPY